MSGCSIRAFLFPSRRRPPRPAPRPRGASKARLLLWMAAAFLAGAPPAGGADAPLLAPESGPWPAGGGFSFATKQEKIRRSVSGIACPPATTAPRVCLVAFDEGAALDGGFFYVAGSHAARRGDCRSNPDSRHVVRFRRDPATGRAARGPGNGLADRADATGLWATMAKLPELAPYVGERKCLGTEPPRDEPSLKGSRGVNIEGLAAGAGRLHFGFRGPAVDGRAPILSVDAAELFDGGRPRPEVAWLELGPRRGVRDLQAVKDGLLVLAGPDDDAASAAAGWVVALWDGRADADGIGRPKVLGTLGLRGLVRRDCDEEIKPEAIAVVEDGPSAYRVLVLSDGMCDGGPLMFRVPR